MSEQGGVVSIVIVNWNTRDLVLRCIESVKASSADLLREVIVVDNASGDGSPEAIRLHHPDVRLIASDTNLGFAAGNNLGLVDAGGDFLLLLNPDTVVPPCAVRVLVEFLRQHEDVGIVAPRLVGADGLTQISSFGLFPSPLEAALRTFRIWRLAPRSVLAKRMVVSPSNGATWTYAEHLLGACLMIRADVMRAIGGFDEGFFLFAEETDLCKRAGLQDWRSAYLVSTEVVHLGEQSMQGILDRTGALYIKSYNRFCRKHGMGLFRRLAVNVFLVTGVLVEALVVLAKRRSLKGAAKALRAVYYAYAPGYDGRTTS